MNPVKNLLQGNNNPMLGVIQMLNGGMSPQAIVQQMAQQDPQAMSFLTQLQNQGRGMTPRDMAFQFAQQNGISKEQVMQMANQIGLK